ncbi:MAG: NUDIX hydrolase [Candidatus Cardinium sp.]|nr:NUDIX hydrolase [Candidatus Cardinium sp.]
MQDYTLQVTVRALIVKNKQLLLVSNDNNLWYTPGGHIKPNETLLACVIREVKEETGITIKPKKLVFVLDFFDQTYNVHKIELYCSAYMQGDAIPSNWSDQDGPVRFVRFFNIETLGAMHHNVVPALLKKGEWLNPDFAIYQGTEER